LSRSFAQDTALEPLRESVYGAVVPEHWFIVTGPNGGWIAAVLTRAMMAASGRSARSLTTHFLEAPAAGPVEIHVTVERAGGSTTFVSLRMLQDGRPVALALGVCADWREGLPEWRDLRPPEVPSPEDAFRIDGERTPVPGFWSNYDGRGVSGVPGQGEAVPSIGWMRTSAPHPRDPVLIAALTDAWLPAAFVRVAERTIVPTLDLTIHWRAPLDDPAPHPWTLLVMRTGTGAGGVWEEDGELWSEDGTLLAQSRQLAIVRRAK
jgi:acyl-CoA thioesterase